MKGGALLASEEGREARIERSGDLWRVSESRRGLKVEGFNRSRSGSEDCRLKMSLSMIFFFQVFY